MLHRPRGIENTPLKAALYIRVSTSQQVEGDSLEEQESELRKFCDFRQFQIHHIYIEKGLSGKNTQRPEYQKLLKDIEAKKIQTVIVKKLDRLSRSLLDFESIMLLMRTYEVEFISLRESFDTTTAMGKAMLRMALVFAQLEREQTAERISDVMQYRASLGHHNGGRPPFGYVSLNKELLISNQQKPIVELIFKRFIETHSVASVVNYLNDAKQFTPCRKLWTDSQVCHLLQNPTYKGMVVWKNQVYPGLHQPIIAPSVWEKTEAILKSQKSLALRSKTNLLLQKLIFCGVCSAPLVPSYAYNRTKTKYSYYRCGSTNHGKHRRLSLGCTFKYVPTEKLHTQVHQSLVALAQETHLHAFNQKVIAHNTQIQNASDALTMQVALAEEELKKIKAKKGEYTDVLISNTFSAQDRYRIHDRLNELEAEEKQWKGKLSTFQLEINQCQDQRLFTDTLIQTLLKFRDPLDPQAPHYKPLIQSLLTKITVSPNALVFEFKDLPWPIEMPVGFSP